MALPNFLYRYGSFKREKGLEHLLDVIEHHRLYFASPEAFNDPFDMRPGIGVDIHSPSFREDYLRFIHEVLRSRGIHSVRKRTRLAQSAYEDLISGPTFQQMYRNYLVTKGVCCLSENANSLLMWAHYTDGHDGYCLQFNTQYWNARDGDITKAEQVIYQSEYPQIDVWALIKERERKGGVPEEAHEIAGRLAVLRKSPEWAYEKEWRIVAKLPSTNTFAPLSLIGVVLGCNTSAETQKRIVDVIGGMSHKPLLFKASLDEKSYALNYDKV